MGSAGSSASTGSGDPAAVTEAGLDALLADAAAPQAQLAPTAPLAPGSGLTAASAREAFADMVASRQLDVAARDLKARGVGWYTIPSAGHERNALLGAQLRATDPALLHYRSGGFVLARHRRAGDDREQVLADVLRSLVASARDPIAQGRHKVWGSAERWIPPQTSTIASHLPKATGTAFAIERARRLGVELPVPEDSIVCCSFGDASANHATALAGINAARYAARRGAPAPVLWVCEDNGLGISVDTPARWVAETLGSWPHLRYIRATGAVSEAWDAIAHAVETCRTARAPVLLHLDVVRLWGHAGSDVEQAYRTREAIAADRAADPLLELARALIDAGAATPRELQEVVEGTREQVARLADAVAEEPALDSAAAVVAPLATPLADRHVRAEASGHPEPEQRRRAFGGRVPEEATAPGQRTLAAHLNATLTDELARRRELLVFGEDVGAKGGVYGVTRGLQRTFGSQRVFDTLLDETTILGLAQGAGLMGLLPVAEIQYLAYVHNALDQLRGEACSQAYFSSGAFRNPMVVRLPGLAYQRGFGGHFHNDNSVGALRDIPGLVVACPARGDDAARMLRGCLGLAAAHGRVVAFLEPIALYHARDLHVEGDEGWLCDHPPTGTALLPGEVGVWHASARDVLVVTYGNGVPLALRAARRLAEQDGLAVRVLDVRWLAPLPLAALRAHARACGAVLVADEARATGGGIADAVLGDLAEHRVAAHRPVGSVRSVDSYVPLGPAADHVLLGEDDVVAGVRRLAAAREGGAVPWHRRGR